MRCQACLKDVQAVYRMNEKGVAALWSCKPCIPDFWERYLARKSRKNKK
nr:hypothetical protein EVB34_028 [Rhizobium phage RHph_TM26]